MLASSFLDPVLGLDVHFEMVPTPAPVPTPIPNPFIGIVFDPIGLACGIALGAAIGAVTGAPFQGPVLYWTAFPATNTGTEAKAVPGHILIPPGVAWAPFPKTPKPVIHPGETPKPALPIKPEDDAVVIFGSKTVTVMGSNAVRLGDIALSCSEPLRLPSSVVLAVPKGAPILIGGPPSLDIMAAIMASLRTRFVSDSLHALLSRLRPSRFRNFLHRAVCFLTGHPVDVASGKVMTEALELELPGPMPLVVERIYSSAFASRSGPLGYGWSLSIDQAVWRERGKVVLLAEDGREIEFDTFDFPRHRIEPGQHVYNPIERLTLHCEREGRWRVSNHEGGTREFAPVQGRAERAMIVRTCSHCGGFEHRYEYDPQGRLATVVDSCGRRIVLAWDLHGRIVAIHQPSPSGDTLECVRRYRYDEQGDLVEVGDALEQCWRFAYLTHLLTQETDRKGLSFHFAYDGLGEDAWCVRTWGDEGIYDHTLAYDKRKRTTFVTNARGHTTQYHMNVAGQVVEIVDPLGGKTGFEYHPHTLARTREVDPLGRVRLREFDERGNVTRVVEADGATTSLEYDAHDRLVAARDVNGGQWSWRNDARGRIVERRSADGGVTRYDYAGAYLASIVDPAGQVTRFGYASNGMVDSMRAGEGPLIRWSHDALGRVVRSEEGGRVRHMQHDALGRLVAIREPDGRSRSVRYDPEGNVLVAKDGKREVHYDHGGLGRVLVRREAGNELRFEYDAEQRLRKVVNEQGLVHEIELDPCGRMQAEIRFDGSRWEYVRDAAGQLVELHRPSGKVSRYRHDAAGRVIEASHADGSVERYVYRGDGLLVEAHNDATSVVLERDAKGRVLRERQGRRWLESDYDAMGRRIGMRSCFGALEQIARNEHGDAIGVRFYEGGPSQVELARAVWEVTIERDLGGEELERRLPGGVRSRWSRDAAGRVTERQIWKDARLELDLRYRWDEGELREIADTLRGVGTQFGHDALGNLAWARQGDAFDLRMPDMVGNLFRRADRNDAQHGPAGQLLLASTAAGMVRYVYDDDGQLIERHEPEGLWRFAWATNGQLVRVERPDGKLVEFEYDALGRRIRKRFEGRTTCWLWAGRVPLHEWIESDEPGEPLPAKASSLASDSELPPLDVLLGGSPPRGPPHDLQLEPAPDRLVTWLFDPGSFVPSAKIVAGRAFSILNDHRGTPIAMFDDRGVRVWAIELDTRGAPRRVEHAEGFDRWACPFRQQGQYEDAETGLYYNRFRYYDPSSGQYVSQDPIGMLGGGRLYAYVGDPLRFVDVLGLDYTGGRHRDTSLPVNDGMDSHHMPAKATYADSALSAADGPAIKMDPPDHRMTASYGSSAGSPEFDIRRQSITDARAARAAGDMDRAKAIIDEAIMRDIDDVLDIARRQGDPGRYDRAIMEMIDSLDDDFYDRITREKSTPPCS